MKERELWDNLPKQLVPGADVCTSRHHGADTSIDAFKATPESIRSKQREQILQYVRRRGSEGATRDEASISLSIAYTAVSARISELAALDMIHDSGRRRPTSHGRTARVYLGGPKEDEAR